MVKILKIIQLWKYSFSQKIGKTEVRYLFLRDHQFRLTNKELLA